jgi:hypothetical protein
MTLPGPVPTPVVFDVNVLVAAIKGGDHPYRSWLSPPPTSRNPHANCLGVVNDAAEFALWLSPHIVSNVARVLSEVLGLDGKHIDDYLQVLMDFAGRRNALLSCWSAEGYDSGKVASMIKIPVGVAQFCDVPPGRDEPAPGRHDRGGPDQPLSCLDLRVRRQSVLQVGPFGASLAEDHEPVIGRSEGMALTCWLARGARRAVPLGRMVG